MDQKRLLSFLGYLVGNVVVLLLADVVFGKNIVLGNDKLSMAHAAIIVGLILTVLDAFVPVVVNKTGLRLGDKSSTQVDLGGMKVKSEYAWSGVYFLANAVIIWIIKRLALILGLGVINVFYVLLLAVLLTFGQWVALKALSQFEKK